MTIRWQDKDPLDVVVVEFDFTPDTAAVSSPVITVSVIAGTDASPGALLSGGATIDGAKVRQRITGGVHGVEYGFQCKANSGSDVLTIEATMRVVTRPIVISETPRYLTQAQFEHRFGADELGELLEGGAAYARAENEAASLVDAYLAARYPLPLLAVPEVVRSLVGDITRFKLWDEHAPEEVRRRYDDALAQLRDLARGTMALPPDSTGASAAAAFDYAAESAERVFTAATLKDF